MKRIGRWAGLCGLAAVLVGGAAFGVTPRPDGVPLGGAGPCRLDAQNPKPADPRHQQPGVTLVWTAPPEARVNQPAPYTLLVANTCNQTVQKVVVQIRVPDGVTASDTDPPAKAVAGVLVWELGTMDPNQGKELKMKLAAPARGDMAAQAWVTFTGTANMTVAVKEPKLEAAVTAPTTVEIGDRIPVTYSVKNTGDARADKVVVTMTPRGAGRSPVLFNTFTNQMPGGTGDALDPGKVMSADVSETADARGEIEYEVVATGADGLKATATARVKVLAPKLDVSITGPAELGLTRTGTYTVKVTNAGDLKAEGVQVLEQLGGGVKTTPLVWAGNGTPPAAGGEFDLRPGESQEFALDATAVTPGDFVQRVSATEKRGSKAAAECRTVVKGVPGIRMELTDSADPVQTRKETTYEVRVSNTGTEADRNLKLVCDLPPGMELVTATGPVEYRERVGVNFNGANPGNTTSTITFEPVRELGPKTEVSFKVTVRATAAGNARFRASITSDHLTTPVQKEESTTVYGD